MANIIVLNKIVKSRNTIQTFIPLCLDIKKAPEHPSGALFRLVYLQVQNATYKLAIKTF